MTQTFFSSIRARILAPFAQLSATGDRPDPSSSPPRKDADGERRRDYERDEDLYRLWAMHGHW